jgi:O-antigen/teichoic acid export membrane protein
LAIHLVEIMTFRLIAWTRLPPPPPGERGAFRPALLRPLRNFALSMGGIALSSMVLTQLDKILISRLLPLDRLGYYTVAATMANGLVLIASPFFTAVFPHFSSASRSHETKSLAHTYHQASKWISLLSAPAAGILIFFSYEVLWVWTRSEELAAAASTALSLLALGYLFNVIVAVPYALQLATGLTWIPLCLNLISVAAAVPLTIACIKLWGISGAAAGILTLTTFTFLAMPHLMHRKILKGEKRSWYLSDTLPFIAASMIIFYLMKSLSSHLGFGKAGLAFAAAGLLVYGLVLWTKFRREMVYIGDAVKIGE